MKTTRSSGDVMARCLLALLLGLLHGCSSQDHPPQASSSCKQFIDHELLFDLDAEVAEIPCRVQGSIPSWLTGTLLRNGPAKFAVGDQHVDWFDGLAMLHAFSIHAGEVSYTNRFLRSEQYYLMTREKSLNFVGFAQNPHHPLFQEQNQFIPAAARDLKNADVSIQQYADALVALTEVPLPVRFDAKTLETLGTFQYQDHLKQGQWESAHPQHDHLTGETVNYFVRFGRESSYVIWKMLDGQSERSVIAEIPVERPGYMHSFALTEQYVVLAEFPLVVNPLDLVMKSKPFIMNYHWEPERGTNFYVIHRATGEFFKIRGDPFFAFHHVNAFEQEGSLLLDIVTYPDAGIIGAVEQPCTSSEQEHPSNITRLERFSIDLTTRALSRRTLFSQPLELPRVSADRVAQSYRYCYAIDTRFPSSTEFRRSLYKIDTLTTVTQSWAQESCIPGEPIFVPDPNSSEEDGGVVLSLILDVAHHASFLLVLDAHTFQEQARVAVPHPVPLGLHGLWFPPL